MGPTVPLVQGRVSVNVPDVQLGISMICFRLWPMLEKADRNVTPSE